LRLSIDIDLGRPSGLRYKLYLILFTTLVKSNNFGLSKIKVDRSNRSNGSKSRTGCPLPSRIDVALPEGLISDLINDLLGSVSAYSAELFRSEWLFDGLADIHRCK